MCVPAKRDVCLGMSCVEHKECLAWNTRKEIHLEITEESFRGFGGRRVLAIRIALLLARSCLVRAHF